VQGAADEAMRQKDRKGIMVFGYVSYNAEYFAQWAREDFVL